MTSQDIAAWKLAIDSARNVINPRRKLLYELYDNIAIDGHLLSVMNKRKMGITNKRVMFMPAKGIETVDEKISTLILETPWFFDFLDIVAGTPAYGHSLIELVPSFNPDELFEKVTLIPRSNVKPELGFVALDALNDTNGIYYKGEKADPTYAPYLIEVGGEKDYGLLMAAAQYVIYKRGGFGDWAQFAELFGMPFRVGKYNPYDDLTRKKLDEALNTMGGAGYAVIPDGTSLEFFNNVQSGQSDIFKNLIDCSNSEMSKIFLGQTMTTDNGSSKSQGEVHKEVEEDINMNDMIRTEYLLNWKFKKQVQAISGINDLEKGSFRFPQTIFIPLDKRWEMDIELSKIIPMSEEYFYKTYGIAKPGEGEKIVVVSDPGEPAPPAQPAGQKKKLQRQQTLNKACCSYDYFKLAKGSPNYELSPEELQLINAIYNKDGVKYDAATFQQNVSKLSEGIRNSLVGAAEYGSADNVAATMMELNINRFGYDKNLAQIYQLNQALSQTGTFNEFKKEATKILGTFNASYLETEYNFAIAVGQNASAWNAQVAQKKDYPYLRYETAGDDRVRAAHQALDGRIFEIDDPSWHGLYPPNGFGCRCEMIPVAGSKVTKSMVTTGAEGKELLGDEWSKMQKGGFAVNRGDTNTVFDLNKSYLSQLPDADQHNMNNLTFKDAGLQKWADMKGLKAMPVDAQATRKALLDEFEANKTAMKVGNDTRAVNLFNDYNDRPIAITRSTLDKHTKGKYAAEHREQFYHNIKDLLANPDEVYLLTQDTDKQTTYRYIKFFSDDVLVVNVGLFDDIETFEIKTWYLSNRNDDVRIGALLKNKKVK